MPLSAVLWGPVHPGTGVLYATARGFDVPPLYQQADIEAEPNAVRSMTNTALAAVATNARHARPQVAKIADLVHDELARAIRPVQATLDGDSVFAISAVENAVEPDGASGFNLTDMVGHAASDAAVLAVLDAASSTQGGGDWPSVQEAVAHVTGQKCRNGPAEVRSSEPWSLRIHGRTLSRQNLRTPQHG